MLARRLAWLVLVLPVAVLAGCGGSGAGPTPPSVAPSSVVDAGSRAYRPDVPSLTSDLFLPASEPAGGVPLVVLVPGGGWTSADPGGLVPLARTLASHGIAAVTTTYRTAGEQAYFPVPVQDVVCAVDDAAARVAAETGSPPGPVIVVGHSAGAQLAALAALQPDAYQADCPSPLVRPDGLVGLAGPYDVVVASSVARSLFAEPLTADPATWAAGNPQEHAAERPDLPALLVHGDADDVVPLTFTESFATALRQGGHEVQVLVLPGLGHQDVYQAHAASSPIEDFTRSVARTSVPSPS